MVKLIHCTPKAEKLIAYMARVSSPKQDNPSYENLIKYLITNRHWSPLEMAGLCLEITTSRAISAQILRHRSFTFQEFSQRYSQADLDFDYFAARRQDTKNRQNSIDDLSDDIQNWFLEAQEKVNHQAISLYCDALGKGISKESARFLLPLSTQTKLYMHGNLRSWVHYIELRSEKATQLEHREIALAAKDIFMEQFPIISKALEWE